jgi:Zn-dependent M28 family amino/carboxypeptidase
VSRFGPKDKPLLVLGAHYDVCGEQPGADDNASGVSGLLEIARQLQGKQLNRQIELVAYTLEEPPLFRRKSMVSYVHAESLKNRNATVEGMVSIEMIGYFSDQLKSQHYPLPILALKYGRTGDFITVVKKMNGGSFSRRFAVRFKKTGMVKTEIFSGPKALPGIDFSDHLNYWKFGFDAVMVTDTAFYRNKNYHESTDTIETLDIKRMAGVVDALVQSISN